MSDRRKDDFYLVVDMDEAMFPRRVEKELRFAVDFLNANRLSESAKWASELLSSIKGRGKRPGMVSQDEFGDEDRRDRTGDNCEMIDEDEEDTDPSTFRDDIGFVTNDEDFPYTFYERKNRANDAVNQARILFDLREYRKACYKIKSWLHPRNHSLRIEENSKNIEREKKLVEILSNSYELWRDEIKELQYSLFLLTEQQSEESNDNVAKSMTINTELISIENELSEYYEKGQLNIY